ncbi:MAG: hypothetical protein EBW03_09355 [Rhodobacteraceae bacterium]|nr:hypothetical protein [Paracoccaceae bacterium]
MIKDQRIPHMGCAHHARRPRANYDGFKSHVPLVAVFNRIGKGDAFYLARGGKIRPSPYPRGNPFFQNGGAPLINGL